MFIQKPMKNFMFQLVLKLYLHSTQIFNHTSNIGIQTENKFQCYK